MVDNQIKVMLAKRGLSAAALSRDIPEMNKVCMSFIVNGITMPTREGMREICSILHCTPVELYDEAELDLNILRKVPESEPQPMAEIKQTVTKEEVEEALESGVAPFNSLEAPDKKPEAWQRHVGQKQLRVWLTEEERAALEKAIKGLGYRSLAEWLREMYRQTLKQYAALQLDGKTLHDLVPPFVSKGPSGTNI